MEQKQNQEKENNEKKYGHSRHTRNFYLNLISFSEFSLKKYQIIK